MKNSEYKDLYNRYDQEKGTEIDKRVSQRKEKNLERNYEEFENQSEVSCITTQSSAQILGELEEMDVPIVQSTPKLNKGIQTETVKEEVKENINKSLISASTSSGSSVNNAWLAKIENKIIHENEDFWKTKLKDDFDNLTISDMREMHKIMLNLKEIINKKPETEEISVQKAEEVEQKKDNGAEELLQLFGNQNNEPQKEPEKSKEVLGNGLEDLGDIFG